MMLCNKHIKSSKQTLNKDIILISYSPNQLSQMRLLLLALSTIAAICDFSRFQRIQMNKGTIFGFTVSQDNQYALLINNKNKNTSLIIYDSDVSLKVSVEFQYQIKSSDFVGVYWVLKNQGPTSIVYRSQTKILEIQYWSTSLQLLVKKEIKNQSKPISCSIQCDQQQCTLLVIFTSNKIKEYDLSVNMTQIYVFDETGIDQLSPISYVSGTNKFCYIKRNENSSKVLTCQQKNVAEYLSLSLNFTGSVRLFCSIKKKQMTVLMLARQNTRALKVYFNQTDALWVFISKINHNDFYYLGKECFEQSNTLLINATTYQTNFGFTNYFVMLISQIEGEKYKLKQKIELPYFYIGTFKNIYCSSDSIVFVSDDQIGILKPSSLSFCLILIASGLLLYAIFIVLMCRNQYFVFWIKFFFSYYQIITFFLLFLFINFFISYFTTYIDDQYDFTLDLFQDICYIQFFSISLIMSIFQSSNQFAMSQKINKLSVQGLSFSLNFTIKAYFMIVKSLSVTLISSLSLFIFKIINQNKVETQIFTNLPNFCYFTLSFNLALISQMFFTVLFCSLFKIDWKYYLCIFIHHLAPIIFSVIQNLTSLKIKTYYTQHFFFYNPCIVFKQILKPLSLYTNQLQDNSFVLPQHQLIHLLTLLISQVASYFIIHLLILYLLQLFNQIKRKKLNEQTNLIDNKSQTLLSDDYESSISILLIRDLSVKKQKLLAIQNLNVDIAKGVCINIQGSNSIIFIKSLLKLSRYSGSIIYQQNIRVGCYLGGSCLNDNLTVQQSLIFFAMLRNLQGYEIKNSVVETLDEFYLLDQKDKKLNELSGGNRQKVQLACCFIGNPDLIILQDPFCGIDINFKIIFSKILANRKKLKASIILITKEVLIMEVIDQILNTDNNQLISNKISKQFQNYEITLQTQEENIQDNQHKLDVCQNKVMRIQKMSISHLRQAESVQKIKQIKRRIKEMKNVKWSIKLSEQNIEDIYNDLSSQTQVIQNRESKYVIAYQILGLFLRKIQIYTTNIFINIFTILIVLLASYTYVNNRNTNQNFVFVIKLLCFIPFQLYSSRMLESKLKKNEYFHVIGLDLKLYWATNLFVDILMITVPFLVLAIIYRNFVDGDYSISNSYLIITFLSISINMSISYIISTLFSQICSFVVTLFFINVFYIDALFQCQTLNLVVIDFEEGILKIISYFYYAFTIQSLDRNGYSDVVIQKLFWQNIALLCFLLIFIFLNSYKRTKQNIVKASEIQIHPYFQLKQQEYAIEDADQSQIPIIASHICKKYIKNNYVLSNVSIIVKKGEIYGLFGPNASGKSTLLNILTSSMSRSAGQIKYFGVPTSQLRWKNFQDIGFCPQTDFLDQQLTVSQNIWYYARIKGMKNCQIFEFNKRYLDLFELTDSLNIKVFNLDSVLRRKLCIVIAFLNKPKILFLDEPTTGLNQIDRRKFWKFIKNYAKQTQAAIVLTTHSINEVEQYCDRVGILMKGELVAIGVPAYLKNKYSSNYRIIVKYKSLLNIDGIRKQIESLIHFFEFTIDEFGSKLIYDISMIKFDFAEMFSKLFEQLMFKKKWIVSGEIYEHTLQNVLLNIINGNKKEKYFDE